MAILILPATVIVVILMGIPLALMARISFNGFSSTAGMLEQMFTAQNYWRAVSDPFYQDVLLTTLGIALLCTIVTLALAFPVAYWLARTESRYKSLFTILTLFPLLVGNVVRAAGWVALLGSSGLVNASLLGAGLISSPVKLMYTPGAVIAGIVGVVLPYMVLTLSAVIESIRRETEEAAANLGASPFTVFRRIVLPQATPGVVAGCALVFILCMNAYSTPVLLGGPQFQMMAPAVYDQFTRASNWPFGAALSFVLLAVTLLLTVAGSALLGRRYNLRSAK